MTFLMYPLTFYLHFYFCLLLMVSSLISRLTYIFILIVSSHIHCLLCFLPSYPHRYVLCLYIDVSKSSLSTFNWFENLFVFCCFIYTLHSYCAMYGLYCKVSLIIHPGQYIPHLHPWRRCDFSNLIHGHWPM